MMQSITLLEHSNIWKNGFFEKLSHPDLYQPLDFEKFREIGSLLNMNNLDENQLFDQVATINQVHPSFNDEQNK
jgi:hypothetical protein